MISFHMHCALWAVIFSLSSMLINERAFAQHWPESYGDDGSGVVDTELRFANNWASVRPVWHSQAKIAPGRVADARRAGQGKTGEPHSGGFASPVVGDGKVFMVTYRPSGEVYDTLALERMKITPAQARKQSEGDAPLLLGPDRWLVGASDVVTAVNLKTGKTVWRRVIDDPGALNFNMFSKGGGGVTPAFADGKLYVHSLGGTLYALDAKTGKTLWSQSVGERAKKMQQLKAEGMKQKMGVRFNRDMIGDVVVIDGMVITLDYSMFKYMLPPNKKWQYIDYQGGRGLVAYDGKTGKRRWALPKMHISPGIVTWTAKNGKRYIIANGVDKTMLIDPRQGRAVWSIPKRIGSKIPCVAHEDWLVGPIQGGGFAIYQIGLKGAKLVKEVKGENSGLVARAVIDNGKIYAVTKSKALLTMDAATGNVIDEKRGANMGTSVEHDNALLLKWGDNLVGMSGRDSRVFIPFQLNSEGIPVKNSMWKPTREPTIGYVRSVLPVFVDGLVIIRTEDGLSAYRIAK